MSGVVCGSPPRSDRATPIVRVESAMHDDEHLLNDVLQMALFHPEPPQAPPYMIELAVIDLLELGHGPRSDHWRRRAQSITPKSLERDHRSDPER